VYLGEREGVHIDVWRGRGMLMYIQGGRGACGVECFGHFVCVRRGRGYMCVCVYTTKSTN
jgi:hypothetical protein